MLKKSLVTLGMLILGGAYLAHALDPQDRHLLDKNMGGVAAKVRLGTKIEQRTKQVVRIVYDSDLGRNGEHSLSTAAGSLSTSATGYSHAMGVHLPANSIITDSWFHVVTPLVDSGAGRLEVYCGERNNIVASTKDLAGLTINTISAGESDTATIASRRRLATACEVQAVVHVTDITSGKAVIFVEHTVSDSP